MRFWITKNSEVSVREQLVRQVQWGILSEDLPAGYKLPSVRALARRHHIHANTVSAAYHDLLTQRWVELRRGSGLYVLPLRQPSDRSFDLDDLLAKMLKDALPHGYQPAEVLQRLTYLLNPVKYERVLIADTRAPMIEILKAELEHHLRVPIEPFSTADPSMLSRSVIAALPTQVSRTRTGVPPNVPFITLRLRSVQEALRGQSRPARDTMIAVVSRSDEIRLGVRTMLIAAGIDPDSLNEVDAARADWLERLKSAALIITDKARAKELPPGCHAMVFHVIADSSVAQLRQLCHN